MKHTDPLMLHGEEVHSNHLMNYWFIVYCTDGRYNGWALVCANNREEARKFAALEWTKAGKIGIAETFKEYCNNLMGEEPEEVFDRDYRIEQKTITKIGDLKEIEWGT